MPTVQKVVEQVPVPVVQKVVEPVAVPVAVATKGGYAASGYGGELGPAYESFTGGQLQQKLDDFKSSS